MPRKLFDFKEAFDAKFYERARQFSHDRSKSLGASETFGCLRRAYIAKKIHPNRGLDEWGMAERGNLLENHFMVPYLRDIFGEAHCKYMGEDQETFFHRKASSTPDGLLVNMKKTLLKKYGINNIGKSGQVVTEFKSFDPRAHLKEPKHVHVGQTHMQMGIFREVTEYKPDYAVLFYVNASKVSDIRVFPVKFDQKKYETGLKRADELYAAKSVEDIMPEGTYTGDCEVCPFTDECSAANVKSYLSIDNDSKLTQDDITRMKFLVDIYDKANIEEKQAKMRKDEAKANIERTMSELNKTSINEEDWRVTWSKIDGRETIDKEKMAADGIDLEKYKKRGNDYFRLTVSRK